MLMRTPGRPTTLLAAMAGSLLAASLAIAAEAPQPARKDSPAKFKPTQAAFSTAVSPAEARAGDTVTYSVSVKLEPTWHIFQYAKQGQPNADPRAPKFDFFDPSGLKIAGDWTSTTEPVRKKEEAFPELPYVEYFEDQVTWNLPLLVPPGTEPGTKTLRNQIAFQICDPERCLSPYRLTLPDVELTVLPGGLAASAAPPTGPTASAIGSGSAAEPAESGAARTSALPNEVERALEEGIVPFLLLAVTGGLIALVMPCVWPMVPITVNFFVKQGEANKGKTLGLAITYCLAIIGIFTLVGVLFSAVFGGEYLQQLANTAWLNILVAVLFLAFGLSLLGVFEFRLPNFLLNASARGESRGGLVGVIFMAMTLTITSFSCTFPVVGGLLMMAAGGSYLYPVIGLATFATVLALPFFVLALAPGVLSRVPRSGDWMNAVKVVGGLVEIGAAFKFINMAECAYVVPEDAWFDAYTVLTIWVVLALISGIYLLGLFRTDHDSDTVKVGPGRILTGSLFLCTALYLTPALFGRPPQSQFYNRLVSSLLPQDAPRLARGGGDDAEAPIKHVDARSSDPRVALSEQSTIIHGIAWGMSYDDAMEQAREADRPVLIDFTGVNCANCRLMEQNVFTKPDVTDLLSRFQTVQLYTDYVPIRSLSADQREELAVDNPELRAELANESTNPFYVVVSPRGEVLASIGGYREPSVFIEFLKGALARHEDGSKVARVGEAPASP